MSRELPTVDNYAAIALAQTPLLDVRAPVEFERGAIPQATNLPLMNDDERHQVGLCYKQRGQQQAIALGHQLVQGELRAERLASWQAFFSQHPNGLLYCFRGGLRSRTSQQWLADAGVEVARIAGGYKAFRQYLIDTLDQTAAALEQGALASWVLAGRTGSGKTALLAQLPGAVDLEGLAQHRGSSFGGRAWSQPSQIDFENRLAYRLIELNAQPIRQRVFEDEARNIGSVHLSPSLFNAIKAGQRIVLEVPFDTRCQHILQEYVIDGQLEFGGLTAWMVHMQARFARIAKRLGGVGYAKLTHAFEQACTSQQATGDFGAHISWIAPLLQDYYDPMYDYQLKRHSQPVIMRGGAQDVLDFMQHISSAN